VGVGNFTQESAVSNSYMLQPWGVYPPAQQFTQSQVGVGTSTQPNMVQPWRMYRPPSAQ